MRLIPVYADLDNPVSAFSNRNIPVPLLERPRSSSALLQAEEETASPKTPARLRLRPD